MALWKELCWKLFLLSKISDSFFPVPNSKMAKLLVHNLWKKYLSESNFYVNYYYRVSILWNYHFSQKKNQQKNGELCFPQTQYVKISTNFFKKILETFFYKVLYNPNRLLTVSNKSHTLVCVKPSQCKGWSKESLLLTCPDGVTPKGRSWWLWQPCEEPGQGPAFLYLGHWVSFTSCCDPLCLWGRAFYHII